MKKAVGESPSFQNLSRRNPASLVNQSEIDLSHPQRPCSDRQSRLDGIASSVKHFRSRDLDTFLVLGTGQHFVFPTTSPNPHGTRVGVAQDHGRSLVSTQMRLQRCNVMVGGGKSPSTGTASSPQLRCCTGQWPLEGRPLTLCEPDRHWTPSSQPGAAHPPRHNGQNAAE